MQQIEIKFCNKSNFGRSLAHHFVNKLFGFIPPSLDCRVYTKYIFKNFASHNNFKKKNEDVFNLLLASSLEDAALLGKLDDDLIHNSKIGEKRTVKEKHLNEF